MTGLLVVPWGASCGGVLLHGISCLSPLSGGVWCVGGQCISAVGDSKGRPRLQPQAGSCLGSLGRSHLSLASSRVCMLVVEVWLAVSCAVHWLCRVCPFIPCTICTPAWVAQLPAGNPSRVHSETKERGVYLLSVHSADGVLSKLYLDGSSNTGDSGSTALQQQAHFWQK